MTALKWRWGWVGTHRILLTRCMGKYSEDTPIKSSFQYVGCATSFKEMLQTSGCLIQLILVTLPFRTPFSTGVCVCDLGWELPICFRPFRVWCWELHRSWSLPFWNICYSRSPCYKYDVLESQRSKAVNTRSQPDPLPELTCSWIMVPMSSTSALDTWTVSTSVPQTLQT